MSRKLLEKNFCAIPWTGFELDPDGRVKNCIISKDAIGNLNKKPIKEILKDNFAFKKQMLDGKYPSSCNGCYLAEKNRPNDFDSISSRLYYAKELGPHVSKNLFDSEKNFELSHVDIRWSNKCNQACVYCGPQYSSKWETELNGKIRKQKSNNEDFKDYIYSNIKNLRNVYLAGGEPLLMKENKEFLELLYKNNPDVTIRVNTNLSKTGTGIFDLLCNFKNVHWTVSVEAMEEEYNYIRFHGDWEKMLENLNSIQKLPHRITFNMLYFILNYKSIFKTIKFFQKQNFHNNSFVLGPLFSPQSLVALNLPNQVMTECKKLLKNTINEKPGFLLQNSLENVLRYLTETKFYANIESTKQTLKIMDLRRKIDSRKVFPQLYQEVLH
jgi:MoaA/NifB/PqqE/SkfB family radical SAM enzyme